jgi:hypothetical protein
MKTVISFLLFTLFLGFSFSQEKGFLRGNIADGQAGGGLYGAKIRLKQNPSTATMSDFDGNFSLSLDPGKYTIEVVSSSFANQEYTDIEIIAGKVTVLDVIMKSDIKDFEAVTVTHTVKRDNESAMLLDRKNASIVTDGLSAQSFRKTGDSDLSGAIKRVTGVTIQDGKYVFVRGLGDRYTQTTLNGLAVPGLDPDVNSLQLDIFPTSVLENVAVFKTSSPELYGDFTGGLVNIVTKKFPTEKTTQIGFGLGFTPGMQFNDDFILYDQGKLDWLGFDDGSRKFSFNPRTKIPDEVEADPLLEKVTRSFGKQLAVKNKTALPNGSFSFNHGNQLNKSNGVTLGYNVVFNYSNETVFYQDFETNEFLKNTDPSVTTLVNFSKRIGDLGKNNVLWSLLASGSMKKGSNSYQITVLNSQNSETSANLRTNEDFNQNVSLLQENVLAFSQRTLTTLMISGTHKVKNTDISWANAVSRSKVDDPDLRETRINMKPDGTYDMNTGAGAGIDRYWRELTEYNESFKVDLKTPLSKNVELKYGASMIYKLRDFSTYSFKHRRNNMSDINLDPDWYLKDDEIWSSDPDSENFRNGTYTIGNYQPANTFSANQSIIGTYIGLFHPLLKVFKLSYGVRLEKTDMRYTGQDNAGFIFFRNEKTLDELNVLPSFNANYIITEKMNVRLGASRSVARPSFREKSIAQIYDPITKRTFNGNINLKQTNINNFDARYEFYLSAKELIAISGFYKQFYGHIEMVSEAVSPRNISARNAGNADLLGAELEIRKALASKEKSKILNRFFINLNVSVIQSRVDMRTVNVGSNGQTEYQLREQNLREGEKLQVYRPMAGQSPYAINAGISYEIPESETSISLSYNVQGEQLSVIASGRQPDVYTDPFHSLNFNAFRSIGKNKKSKITFGVNNILNDRIAYIYKSYGSIDEIYSVFKPGVQFNFRYSYTF